MDPRVPSRSASGFQEEDRELELYGFKNAGKRISEQSGIGHPTTWMLIAFLLLLYRRYKGWQ
jgi:hypothetical protein